MPSPNAASLGKYGDIPVSYHTGVPNVGIPIYTLQEGPISLPISLSYHAGGVKVGEPCSWVGLNWSLQAGGMISRTQQGLADESVNGYLNTGQYLTVNGLNGTVTPIDLATGAKDGEPDIFSFSVGGYSGKFYIGVQPSGTLTGKAVVIPKQDIKVEYFLNAGYSATRLYKFKVTTPEGIIYEFGNNGTGTDAIEISQSPTTFWTANAWYLKKITSPDLASTIDFTYAAEQYRQYSKKSPGSTESSSSGGVLGVSYMDYQGWRLNAITTSGAGVLSPEKVTFVAGSPRTDILQLTSAGVANTGNEAKTLASIKIENGTTECKNFVLSQSYWQDNSSTAFVPVNGAGVEANYRLKLNSVQEQSCGGVLLPATTFTYYSRLDSANLLPNRYSPAIDHWGYYNGAMSNPSGGFNIPYTRLKYFKTQTNSNIDVAMGSSNRETDETNMKLGTLQTITYPTGGNTSFEYEANDYFDIVGQPALATESTLSYFMPDGQCNTTINPAQSITTTITNTDNMFFKLIYRRATEYTSICSATNSVTLRLYNTNAPTTVLCSTTISPGSTILQTGTGFTRYTFGTQEGFLRDLFPCLPVAPGTGVYKIEIQGWNSAAEFTLKKEITVGANTNRKVGGLRVKKITTNDAVNVANNIVKTYDYKTDGTTPAQSSAVLYSIPTYSAVYDPSVISYGLDGVLKPNTFKFHVFTDYSIVPLGSFEGATVGYSTVKESLSNGAYTKYTYFQEAVQSYAGTPIPPTQPRIEAGNLSAKFQINSAGTTVASETNTFYTGDAYSWNSTASGDDKYYKSINHTLVLENQTAFFLQYKIRNKPYRLSQMVSVLDGVTTTTNYNYDPALLSKRSETVTNSNAAVTTSTYYYSTDDVANYSALISRNMIGFPVLVKQQTGNAIKWSKVEYALFNTTQIEPAFLKECFDATQTTWITRLQISAYATSGMPSTIYKNNFTVPETYTWTNKLLTQKVFGNVANRILTWAIAYKPSTSLVAQMTDENGLIKKYTYDPLSRLQIVQDRMDAAGANVQATTNYTYQYKDGSNPLNYIGTSTTFINATNTTPLSTKQYMDGLGRPVSTVRETYTPNLLHQKNNVTYDVLGRQDKSYLPFEGSALGYEATPALTPYSYATYELSPLSRPLRQYAEDGKYMETKYGTNTATEVRKFTVTANGDGSNSVVQSGNYDVGSLFKTIVLNENGTTLVGNGLLGETEIFKDKLGRVILTRKWVANVSNTYVPVNTYNMYDDFNNLVMVAPPDAIAEFVASSTINLSLVFQYQYDYRNRLIKKKVPNADWVNFYYDARDLLTLTQDGNMRTSSASKYLGTEYNEIGQVVKTGWVTTTTPVTAALAVTIAEVDKLTETQYYPNRTWVKHQAAKVLKNTGVATEREYIWSYIERRVGAEYTGNPVWTGKQHLLSKTYLNGTTLVGDAPITDNDYGGVNWTVSGYDGAQKPTATINYLYSGPNTTHVQEVRQWQTFNYDNGQRLKSSNYTYALNGTGVTSPTAELSNMTYNVRNQVIKKNTALVSSKYLQSTDFAYNDRGWLTSINSGFAESPIDYPLFASANSAQAAFYATLATTGFLTPLANGGESNPDLFKEIIRYDNPNTALNNNGTAPTPQYNGNISQVEWQVAGREAQAYSFKYDNLERLIEANYTDIHASNWATRGWISQYETDNKYQEKATYDFRGNITTMNRNGKLTDVIPLTGPVVLMGIFGGMDNLTYTYDATDKNKLIKVADASPFLNKGFLSISAAVNSGATHYAYDANGNLISDVNKGITAITYNHLNLPLMITFTNNASAQPRRIEFIYDATGVKLRKTVFVNSIATDVRDYINGIEYKGGALDRFPHTEGSVVRQSDGVTFLHEYTIKDHLGNARVTYTDANNDGVIGSTDIKQINSYYPFGLNMEGNFNGANGTNKYQYNGKEWNDDFGLGLNDYGARFYDAAIARFIEVDPKSEKFIRYNPYNYVCNRPTVMIDPNGMEATFNAKTGELEKATGKDAANWLKGQQNAMNKEPVKNQTGTIDGFISDMSNSKAEGGRSDSRMGRSTGAAAANNLQRLGETAFSSSHGITPATTGPFNTSSSRYVYTACGGWVDMVHFLFYAGKAYTYKLEGNKNPIGQAVQDGWHQERSDAIGFAKHSKFSYEDLPSDKFGADFAVNYFKSDSNQSLGEQIRDYFKMLGAISPQFAPNYQQLPERDGIRKTPTYQNMSTTPLFTTD